MSSEFLEKVKKANEESIERGRLNEVVHFGDPIDTAPNATLSDNGRAIMQLPGCKTIVERQ